MKHIIYNIKNARRRENVFRIALSLLKQGGLLVFPSDTVYGLMADASNEKAVRKLISFKNRPPGKAISIFAADYRMLKENADIDAHKLSVIKKILPGPFTVILKSRHRVSRLLESEYGTLGLRIPMDENIVDLVKKFGRPLTATSANLSGQSPHYSVDSFLRSLSKSKKS